MTQKKLPLINSAHGSETRNIINELIKLFNQMGYTYDQAMQMAQDVLDEAQQVNESNVETNQRLDNIIADSGTSSTEVVDARGDFTILSERLNKKEEETTRSLVESRHLNTNFTAKKSNRPLVSFVDDDGASAVLDKLVPLGGKHDIPFVIAPFKDRIISSTGLSLEEIKSIQDDFGHEIASHSSTHQAISSEMTKEQQKEEIYGSWKWMREQGLNIETFVYPYGQNTEYARSILTRYYKSGVSTSAYHNGGNGEPLSTQTLGRFAFPEGDGTYPLSHYTDRVDQAIAENAWIIFMLHCGQEVHDETNQQILDDLIAYIKSQQVDIVKVTDGIDIVGNPIDFNERDLYISKTGKNNIRDAVYHPINRQTGVEEHTGDTLPDGFPDNKLSIDPVSSGPAQNSMPVTDRGTLITYKNYTGRHAQLFHSRMNFHYRSSDNVGKNWEAWKRVLIGEEITVSADFGTLSSGEKKQMTVSVPDMVQGNHIIVTPTKNLLSNIHFTYFNAGGGNLRLTMESHRSGDYEIGLIEFNVFVTRV